MKSVFIHSILYLQIKKERNKTMKEIKTKYLTHDIKVFIHAEDENNNDVTMKFISHLNTFIWDAVSLNLQDGYENIAEEARQLAKVINALIREYGKGEVNKWLKNSE